MSRRVRTVVATFFALLLVINAPIASAAMVDRDRGFTPRFMERVIRAFKQVLKPLVPSVQNDDQDEFKPTPPKP